MPVARAARGRHGATITGMTKHIEPTAANHGTSIIMIAQEPAIDPRLVRSTAAAMKLPVAGPVRIAGIWHDSADKLQR